MQTIPSRAASDIYLRSCVHVMRVGCSSRFSVPCSLPASRRRNAARRRQPSASHDAGASQVPIHGPRACWPHRLRGRRSRGSQHVLPRLGVGRRVEVDGRRQHLHADLRRPGRRGDRQHCRGRLRSEHRLGRHRRAVGDPLQRRHGRRRLQVGGRRQDLEAHGPDGDRPHRARPHPSHRTRTSSTSAPRAA